MARLQAELQQTQSENAGLRETIGARNRQLAENAQLQAALQQAQNENTSLRQRLTHLQASADATRQEFVATRALVPPQLGGTATPASLRDDAHNTALRLAAAHRDLLHNPSSRTEYQSVVAQLAQEQLRLAGAIGARGVYRIRSEDTLARVAARQYGESGRWSKIYQANRHVLENADQLRTDVTLVIP
jgi:nucleoid-associated protein YgaU